MDVVGRVDVVDALAPRYPEVSFIVPHLGAFADRWDAQLAVIERLRRLPNVYADTSGVRYWEILVRAARQAPHKLLFGSDGPFLHPAVELYKLKLLRLPPHQEAMLMGGTILRLLGPVRAGQTATHRNTSIQLVRE
jgi:predicted TIM-barrel fold metal-dependent hydrolase